MVGAVFGNCNDCAVFDDRIAWRRLARLSVGSLRWRLLARQIAKTRRGWIEGESGPQSNAAGFFMGTVQREWVGNLVDVANSCRVLMTLLRRLSVLTARDSDRKGRRPIILNHVFGPLRYHTHVRCWGACGRSAGHANRYGMGICVLTVGDSFG